MKAFILLLGLFIVTSCDENRYHKSENIDLEVGSFDIAWNNYDTSFLKRSIAKRGDSSISDIEFSSLQYDLRLLGPFFYALSR
jgi:hypothetical protein